MIRKARKKPIEIEWISFGDLENTYNSINFAPKSVVDEYKFLDKLKYIPGIVDKPEFEVTTLTGKVIMNKDYHLLIGVDGELYPCRIDIFKETYEVIE